MRRELAIAIALIGVMFYVGILAYGFYNPPLAEAKHKQPHVKWIEFKQGLKRDDDGQLHESD
jgi:hypothetical protein